MVVTQPVVIGVVGDADELPQAYDLAYNMLRGTLEKESCENSQHSKLISGHFGVRGFITAFLLPKACATTETQWYRYPGFEQLACVRARNVYVVDGNAYFNRPAPRLVDSLEMLAHFLHPNLHRFPENVQPIHRVMPTVRSQ